MILYLILAHRSPEQVMRLARRLIADDRDARVAIHYDASADPIEPVCDARIMIVPESESVEWGGMSVVAALLRSLHWIRKQQLPFRWLVLLSGQDYPIRNTSGYAAALDQSGADGFIEHAPIDARFAAENETRYLFNHHPLPSVLARIVRRAWRINGLQSLLRLNATRAGCYLGTRSSEPFGRTLHAYRGSFWCTLSRQCIDYLDSYVTAHPRVAEAFAKKLVPDEAFVHSILASAGTFTLINDDHRYIEWPNGHTGSPAVLHANDAARIFDSGKMFARKFDANTDSAILDLLDAVATGYEPARRLRATP